jgi:hypothetical protein
MPDWGRSFPTGADYCRRGRRGLRSLFSCARFLYAPTESAVGFVLVRVACHLAITELGIALCGRGL